MEGKYIYCITKRIGIQNLGSVGINNGKIGLLPYRDIAAVVSSTPIINFDRLNKEELTKYVAIHQQVNEAITKERDVVPLAFGVIAPSASEVMRILARVYLQFKQALKKVEGKVEFAVQISWDCQKELLEELANTNPEIQRLKQGVLSRGKILTIPVKLKLGKLLQQETENLRKAYVKDIQACLGRITHNLTLNKLIDQDMLANFSVLINRTEESALDAEMQELGEKYDGKLKIKYIGPMPPYSFSSINLSLGNFELVDSARKVLGLEQEVTLDEIRKAYHRLAHKYHPDKYGASSQTPDRCKGGDGQMNKITQAHSILTSYCQAYDEALPDGRQGWGKIEQRYSFRKEDVKNSIIIQRS